jgi:hypothetical protein
VIEERRYFLEVFLKEVIALPYLVGGVELQTFLRPVGEVDKALAKLHRDKPLILLQCYRATLNVPEVSCHIFIFSGLRRQASQGLH